jgi:hypothetical protein
MTRLAFFALAAALVAACSADDPTPQLCSNIPEGGCPLSHGVACDDPSCVNVYACYNGSWTLDHTCPARDGGAGIDGGSSDASNAETGNAADVSIDAPPGAFGGPGCPDLQEPDCSLGTALTCPSHGDCCGCEDLFVCQNGAWLAWGSCVDGGISH